MPHARGDEPRNIRLINMDRKRMPHARGDEPEVQMEPLLSDGYMPKLYSDEL